MIDIRAVGRYAKAFFELALKSGKIETIESDFREATKVIEKYPQIGRILNISTITVGEKKSLLDKIFPAPFSPLLMQFFQVLVAKGRFHEVIEIEKEFYRLYEIHKGIQEVEITTAEELSPSNKAKFESAIKKKLRSEIRLTHKVNPSILGGYVMRFGGKEINTSYKARLEEIRQALLS